MALGAVSAGVLTAHCILNHALLRRPRPPSAQHTLRPTVSVLIPARDEARRIVPTLRSALRQRGVSGEVIVLDDRSTDDTAAIATRTATDGAADNDAAESDAADNGAADNGAADNKGLSNTLDFHVMQGRTPPQGWLGKPHACAQLAAAATGEVLVFLDADVVLAPDALASAVDLLVDSDSDLLSPYPRQIVGTTAERLVQPLLQWSWLTFLPLRLAERLTSPMLTAGNGQFMVCRAAAYGAAGGHEAVAGSVLEDIELARRFKAAGMRVGMADGTDLATCRMYEGWDELRDGYGKSLWIAFGSPGGAVAVLALLAAVYVLPPVGMVIGLATRRWSLARTGAIGYALGVMGRAYSAIRTGGRPADAVAHPVSVVVLIGLTVRSFRHRRLGLLTWKGRAVT